MGNKINRQHTSTFCFRYTMSKSTGIVFILIFAVILKLEKLVSCLLRLVSQRLIEFSFDVCFRVGVCHWLCFCCLLVYFCSHISLRSSNGLVFCWSNWQLFVAEFDGVYVSCWCNGLKWVRFLRFTVSERKWTARLGLHNPIDMVFHVQPWMILSILPLAFAFEGKQWILTSQLFLYIHVRTLLKVPR